MLRRPSLPASLVKSMLPKRAAATAASSSGRFWSQLSMGIMYVLLLLCAGYIFQLLLNFEKLSDEDLVDKYLLQQGSLSLLKLGSKPKLWIPLFRDQNRQQSGNYLKSFLDRTPEKDEVQLQILQLTLRTIERHNSEQFQIVLVDDSTFTQIIPAWSQHKIDLQNARTSEAIRKHMRELGMLMLLYLYGGMVLPASFICTSSLKDTYFQFTEQGQYPFFAEHSQGGLSNKLQPGMRIMGAPAGHYILRELMEHLVQSRFPTTDRNHMEFPYIGHMRTAADRHFEHAEAFKPTVAPYLRSKGNEEGGSRELNIVPGEYFGVCTVGTSTTSRKVLTVDQWFMKSSEKISDMYTLIERLREDRVRGLDFPFEGAMDSKKYNWIGRVNTYSIMKSKTMLSVHLHFALFDRREKEDEAEITTISTVL